ncbi:MAG: AAA family ATPase [Senegalia sp. (in: firmicutes)]|uniref:AAA family ATPase n=1 Tax=Senegalia sp. (in: firmicutes) TaxID=1924098 RepID=UPI003F9C9B31
MKYITNVEINNFQSHKNTNIDFVNGLNVIVGPSDQGKTAIIRAIKWVLYNDPMGTFFIRHKEKEASVILTFNTGEKVQRLRSNTKNLYIYIDKDNNEEIYEGFGHNVPVDIIEKINIRKIFLDSKESNSINIGEQLEGPFLLSEKNSTRANAIGRLVGVHVVDKAVQNTMKDIRNLNSSNKSLIEDIDLLETKLKDYSYLDDLEATIIQLETLQDIISYKENLLKILIDIQKKYNENDKLLIYYKDIYSKLLNLETINNISLEIENKTSNRNILVKSRSKISNINQDINENQYIISNTKNINLSTEISNDLEEKIYKYKNLIYKNKKYKDNSNIIKNTNMIKDSFKYNDDLKIIFDKLINKNNELDRLRKLKSNYTNIKKSISKGKDYINKFKYIDDVNILYEKINIDKDKYLNLNIYLKKINQNNNNINELNNKIRNEKSVIIELLNDYKSLLKKIERCPLCFNSIDNEDMNRIIKNLSE